MTGWTPQQIRELSVGQLNEYIEGWSELYKTNKNTDQMNSDDVELFNLVSGIQRKKLSKP